MLSLLRCLLQQVVPLQWLEKVTEMLKHRYCLTALWEDASSVSHRVPLQLLWQLVMFAWHTDLVLMCLSFVHRQSFSPSFSFLVSSFFFFLGEAITLIAAGSLSMGHVRGLRLFQTKYYSTVFMLDLADVMLLLPWLLGKMSRLIVTLLLGFVVIVVFGRLQPFQVHH